MTADEIENHEHERLIDPAELLLRQVHPFQLLAGGKLSSVAFRPSSVDAGFLSTRREHIGAERAYREWKADHESAGTWALSVHEVENQSLSAIDDSSEVGQPEGHVSVDFNGNSPGMREKKGRRLRDSAHQRGCLHPVSQPI